MIESARPLNAAIDRLPADVFTAFGQLAPTDLCDVVDLMIGGPKAAVQRLDPIFKTLAPGRGAIERTPGRDKVGGTAEDGYLHCGESGAGHFVKMVHNGIEYGIMAAYAEGFNVRATPTWAAASAPSTPRRRRCAIPSTTSTS